LIKNKPGLLLLLVALASCAERATHSTTAVPEPQPIAVPGMANTVRVGEVLFGGQPSQEALRDLKSQGYKTVLSTRASNELAWDEKALADSLGLRFVTIPMEKPVTAITDDQVSRFADLMKTREHPMLLHCGSGNRVAGLWAVWLVEHGGVTPDEALRLGEKAGMTRIRPVVQKRLGLQVGE
jgi:uncharacterized protein (TIGR01244 family)